MDEDISARRRASIRRPGAPKIQPVTAAGQWAWQKNISEIYKYRPAYLDLLQDGILMANNEKYVKIY